MEIDRELTEALRERGHRVTLPRLLVHRFVRRAPQHVTADDVHAEIPSLSTATIYATLDLFEELGVVRRVSTLEGATVFDSRTDAHDHAVCRRCGKIMDVEASSIDRAHAPSGFTVERTEVQLVGLCETCAAAA